MKIARLALLTGALATCAPELVRAQSLPILTRATGVEVTDSALFLVTIASPFRTRAVSLGVLKGAFVPAFADSATGAARAQVLTTSRTLWGLTFNGSANVTGKPAFASAWSSTGRDSLLAGSALAFAVNDTVYGQPVWNATQAFATGQLVDSATGSARSQTLTTARTLWGQSFNGSANVTAAPTFGAGATVSNGQTLALGTATISGTPTWSSVQTFAATQRVDSATGSARSQTLTTARALWGQSFDGSGAITGSLTSVGDITGGASSMNLLAGTGASRRLVFQTTTSGSTATTFLRGNEVQQSLFTAGTAALPSVTFAGDSITGMYKFGTDTIGFATAGAASLGIMGGATPTIFGGAGNLTMQCGTGNSRTCTFKSTTSGGVATTALSLNAVQQVLIGTDGSASVPGLAFRTDPTTGFSGGSVIDASVGGNLIMDMGSSSVAFNRRGSFSAADGQSGNDSVFSMLQISKRGTFRVFFDSLPRTLHLSAYTTSSLNQTFLTVDTTQVIGFPAGKLTGGANDFTFIAGTGNSRRYTAQTTTSGGTATTFLRANELQQSLFANGAVGTPGISFASDSLLGLYRVGTAGASDTIMVAANGVNQMKIAPAGILRLPLLPAEGSTKNAMCWDGTTFNVTQNAAATCTVSSARFKENIVPLDALSAWEIIGKPQLHSSTYNERAGGRLAIGIVAEQADSADARLASRDGTGLITSTNYEEITSLLLPIVKELRATVKDQQRVIDSMRTAARKKP